MKDFSTTSIIIPTLNEEHNIVPLIQRLHELYSKISVIVADDGSTDNTQTNAKQQGVIVIDRSGKIQGITAAVIDALTHVKTKNIIVMDADFQHPPEKVADIVDLLEKNDIVIAARRRVLGHWGFFRQLQSRIATLLAQLRIGNIKDPLSGFFGIKTELFHSIQKEKFELRCFKILVNILKSTDVKKLRIAYVDYDFDMRTQDTSKIRLKHAYYFIRNILR